MARGEKPYRVYRGGRAKGRVPLQRRAQPPVRDSRPRTRPAPPVPAPVRRRRRSWGRRIGIGLLVLFLIILTWVVASYLMLSGAVEEANQRLPPVPLDEQTGLVLTEPTTILLLGTDSGPGVGRETSRRSDSIMLVRSDPRRGRIAFLSVPRDLRADIPGRGFGKINAAFQLGGPPLALRAVRNLTGLRVNHMLVIDFRNFVQLVDALGGVEIDVPEPIVANKFDCPFKTQQQCDRWPGWRFGAGKQTMNGRRALVYSRIRENRLNPAENDLTRGERQQAVVRAIVDELTSFSTAVKMPWIADDIMAPLATDLSAAQFMQLALVKARSGSELRCRLGGTPSEVGGESFLIGSEENRNVVLMFLGAAAPQPPLPGSGPFGAGCIPG
jgi:polyisoprenyl-teichoic acid--peptidoglycan teichoic acid transferase